ncbi:MAG: LysR family transcriptional regulator [Alphaproteobacteria bacterium]|jgi:molybdate transport system regulatory protein|nr:LysR family transcriptional regulator [Alphaproteobacteria bacterium]MBT4086645.1 LysR family transcriptional regulator [Alphaproteobacteria bacterium]MBT4545290.1 LysR family transcriptional regulator [Alphaproteobacteria bacterium]MBT7744474.1 LysR family transcriptional regulator [Alphaproteobacteria bacterium]
MADAGSKAARGQRKTNLPRVQVLFGAVFPLGPGKAALIEAVGRTGSISGAAREMGMSYARAWKLITATNACFREPLVATSTGGPGGGGAYVTDTGVEVLRRYRDIEDKAVSAVTEEVKDLSGFLNEAIDD